MHSGHRLRTLDPTHRHHGGHRVDTGLGGLGHTAHEGEGAHKAMFGTDAVNACSFFMMKKGLTNRMLLSSVDAFDAGVAHLKAATTQSGTLAKARQLLRA